MLPSPVHYLQLMVWFWWRPESKISRSCMYQFNVFSPDDSERILAQWLWLAIALATWWSMDVKALYIFCTYIQQLNIHLLNFTCSVDFDPSIIRCECNCHVLMISAVSMHLQQLIRQSIRSWVHQLYINHTDSPRGSACYTFTPTGSLHVLLTTSCHCPTILPLSNYTYKLMSAWISTYNSI